MLNIRKHLLPGRSVDNARDGVNLVTTTLSDCRKPWLLVFDNFDNLNDIPDIINFFPDSSCGRILITSRSAVLQDLGEVIEVGQMEKDESVELLLHSYRAEGVDVSVVEKILARLEYLPLAIDLVRAYISKQQLCLVDFEEEYDRRKRNFMMDTLVVCFMGRQKGLSICLPHGSCRSNCLMIIWWNVLTLFAFLHPVSIRERTL